ncbi:unnamed protein product [Microthlaspi erraticum]|uniref:Reverse transcriptase Ty1/copia-type domain-containing protein n=1 Tax=Microthlaspi erraticum TaxID=1685480 RepID=A0A6D2I7B4_9BRAS|nr:unnamed protein product [Microthlaspi erraticum]
MEFGTLFHCLKDTKQVGCKWVFKTKLNCNGNVERYKARLVAKGFNQKEGIDYETFSPVSRKDSLRIILALVAQYDLELHQMDVKTAFLNGDLEEEVYMCQPEGFIIEGQENMVCKLKKSIYGLKQASRQWYLKFDEIITKFGFKENIAADPCIYLKISGSKFIFLVCTRPDISHAVGMLGRFQSNPGLAHWKAAKKVLRYLKGTRNNMLTYRKSTHPQMVGFSDSDFGGCHDSRHCTLGYVYLLCGGILVAEFVSEFKALSFVDKPLTLYCDNQAAIFFSKHDRISKGAKHMDLKYLSLKQDVKREKFVIEHIGTELMVADIFTKALPPKTFKKHAESMGLEDSS